MEIILASQSPRRKQLLEAADIDFDIVVSNIEEHYPEKMPLADVPEYLAALKAAAISIKHPNAVIIAADTIVLLNNQILGKPQNAEDAVVILNKLSGKMHEVITGVVIRYQQQDFSFSSTTKVFFRPLTETQIHYYVNQYQPFDKAGAYAIQEWIGMIGIEKIEGDYYNVMGLPIGQVVKILSQLTKE